MTVPVHQGTPRPLWGGGLTICVLVLMAITLAWVRFGLLPSWENVAPVPFDFRNPMLDARPGERVLVRSLESPGQEVCLVVRPEGLVLRAYEGPDQIGMVFDMKRRPAYLACSQRPVDRAGGCSTPEAETEVMIYGLNDFGLEVDSQAVVESIMPRKMIWGERELVVYEVEMRSYGLVSGHHTTWLAEEAPVAGLVGVAFLPTGTNRTVKAAFRDILDVSEEPPAR